MSRTDNSAPHTYERVASGDEFEMTSIPTQGPDWASTVASASTLSGTQLSDGVTDHPEQLLRPHEGQSDAPGQASHRAGREAGRSEGTAYTADDTMTYAPRYSAGETCTVARQCDGTRADEVKVTCLSWARHGYKNVKDCRGNVRRTADGLHEDIMNTPCYDRADNPVTCCCRFCLQGSGCCALYAADTLCGLVSGGVCADRLCSGTRRSEVEGEEGEETSGRGE